MFTPPPSPDPRRLKHSPSSPAIPLDLSLKLDAGHDLFLSPSSTPSRSASPAPDALSQKVEDIPLSPKEDPYAHALLKKKRIAQRTRLAVLLVPFVLVMITLCTRFLTHPAALDIISSSHPPSWSAVKDWTPHKRHASPDPAPAATTVENTKPTNSDLSLAPSASAAPTQVNSGDSKVPWTKPVLPTPFPQPFDSTFSTNFTTVGCQNFMTNMTETSPFRQCRPFSLLVGDSNEFITSQRNISQLNIILWGTCNTDLAAEQCVSNMAWFATNIETQCKQDIDAKNAIVLDAVAGLQSYSVMREAACQVNNKTDTYCYVEAAQSTHPSDLYLYQLPLGLSLPNSTVPSCTPCVQGLMKTYAEGATNLPKLRQTYPEAARIVNNNCGNSFVAAVDSAGGNGARALDAGMVWVMGALALLLTGQLML